MNKTPLTSNGHFIDKPIAAEQWESLQSAATRAGYAYQTFKNWKSRRKLPFPIYINNLVRPREVDQWIESTKQVPCDPSVERLTI